MEETAPSLHKSGKPPSLQQNSRASFVGQSLVNHAFEHIRFSFLVLESFNRAPCGLPPQHHAAVSRLRPHPSSPSRASHLHRSLLVVAAAAAVVDGVALLSLHHQRSLSPYYPVVEEEVQMADAGGCSGQRRRSGCLMCVVRSAEVVVEAVRTVRRVEGCFAVVRELCLQLVVGVG